MLPECEESIENTNSNGSRIPEEENIKFYFKKIIKRSSTSVSEKTLQKTVAFRNQSSNTVFPLFHIII